MNGFVISRVRVHARAFDLIVSTLESLCRLAAVITATSAMAEQIPVDKQNSYQMETKRCIDNNVAELDGIGNYVWRDKLPVSRR